MEAAKGEMIQRPQSNGVQSQQDVIRTPGAPPPEDYVHGFEGMATTAFSEAITKVLRAPIPEQDVEIKPDGIVYLPGVFYRQRLTDAFGPGGWAIAPRSPAKRAPAAGGELVMYHGALWCHGRYVSEAVGQCVYYPNNAGMTYADAFEGAKTDAITRCCKDLFIASELWDPTWRTQWQAKYARQVKKRAQVWNPETRNKEWGEKEVWERKDRAQKLGAGAPGASGATGSAGAAGTEGSGSATGSASPAAASSTADTGEAPSAESLTELEDLVFEKLKWSQRVAVKFLRDRFGVDGSGQLTKMQVKTAFVLLFAAQLGKADYEKAVAAQAAEGRCKP